MSIKSCNSQRLSGFRCFCTAREHERWWAMTVLLKAMSAPRSWKLKHQQRPSRVVEPSPPGNTAKKESANCRSGRSTHLSSSSSIKPLPSLSRMAKAFFTSWGLFWVRPQAWKNFLGQKVSGAGGGQRTAPSVFGVGLVLFCSCFFFTKLEWTPFSISTFSDS